MTRRREDLVSLKIEPSEQATGKDQMEALVVPKAANHHHSDKAYLRHVSVPAPQICNIDSRRDDL